jgi:hypothetical protein
MFFAVVTKLMVAETNWYYHHYFKLSEIILSQAIMYKADTAYKDRLMDY